MDRTGRPSTVPLKRLLPLLCLVTLTACDTIQDLVDPAELEAQLRSEPGRGGKVGQLVGIDVVHLARRHARTIQNAPDTRCALNLNSDTRWVAELTLERRRGTTLVSSWTETRTLDHSESAVAMRLAATFHTEIDGEGSRNLEWRVVPEGTYLSAEGRDGDLWYRRETEEDERERVLGLADGMLQSLVDSVDGWKFDGDSWSEGDEPLRCAAHTEGLSFVDRFVASAKIRKASLHRNDSDGRHLAAEWTLSDGSVITAVFDDRLAPLPSPITPPPSERLVPIEPDHSLAASTALLAKLAADGLAEVASPPQIPDKGQNP